MTRYSIIKADLTKNQDNILPILNKNLSGTSPEKYEWKYKNCPYGAAHCWLAKYEQSNTFIGTAALFPRVINVKGESVCAAVAGDFAVDIQHRNLATALSLQREIQLKLCNTPFKFIYLLPNEDAKGIFLRIGYKKMGGFKQFFKPLRSEYKNRHFLHPFLQFKIFALAFDFLIKIIAKENRYKTTLKYSIESPKYFDDRFDVLWKSVSKHSTILGERTSVFLNWRYIQPSKKNYAIFCLLDEHKNIIGYIVYFLENGMCYIVDMLYELSMEVLSLLLAEFSRYTRMKGAGSISVYYLGGRLLEEKLLKFNFIPIKNKEQDILIYSPDMANIEEVFHQEKWHFFHGDNDV
jgi:hypothetical protein